MRYFLAAFVQAWLAALVFQAASVRAADLLIENVSLIAVEPARVAGIRNVFIHDGRIAAISDKPIPAAAQATRLDGRGQFLAPGLMDSHVHVSDAAGIPFVTDDTEIAALRAAFLRQQPRSYLYFRVTQVLDPSNDAGRSILTDRDHSPKDVFKLM